MKNNFFPSLLLIFLFSRRTFFFSENQKKCLISPMKLFSCFAKNLETCKISAYLQHIHILLNFIFKISRSPTLDLWKVELFVFWKMLFNFTSPLKYPIWFSSWWAELFPPPPPPGLSKVYFLCFFSFRKINLSLLK